MTTIVPAFYKAKYKTTCSNCGDNIAVGSLIFWSSSTKISTCSQCADPAWKLPGTPYDIRKKAAIAYAYGKKPAAPEPLKPLPVELPPRPIPNDRIPRIAQRILDFMRGRSSIPSNETDFGRILHLSAADIDSAVKFLLARNCLFLTHQYFDVKDNYELSDTGWNTDVI